MNMQMCLDVWCGRSSLLMYYLLMFLACFN
jgi:hypothetical protein